MVTYIKLRVYWSYCYWIYCYFSRN